MCLKSVIFPLTQTHIFATCLWSIHGYTKKKKDNICKLTILFKLETITVKMLLEIKTLRP